MDEMRTVDAPLVSIVVPVYNAERYLDRCVESILAQTLESIQVILVDDGSGDGSLAICEKWAARDGRVEVVRKANGGPGSARNAGVACARAPYLGFVDSDDYVAPTMYEMLYGNLIHEDADVSICGVFSCYEDRVVTPESVPEKFTLTNIEAMREILSGRRLHVWDPVKLYPTSVVREHPFREDMTYEDAYAVVEIFPYVRKVVVDLTPQYYYWRHADSVTTKKVDAACLDIVKAYDHCYEVVAASFPDLLPEAEFRRIWSRFQVLDKVIMQGDPCDEFACKLEDDMIAFLRDQGSAIEACPYFGRGRKMAYGLLRIHPLLYRQVVKIKGRKSRVHGNGSL